MTKLSQREIKKRIPHRFENLLLDECELLDDSTCKYHLTINSNDLLNRDVFSSRLNQYYLFTPILAEISALASIVGSGTIEPGTYAYFAAISNFSCNSSPFKLNQKISGVTKKTSSKNGFFKYSFNLLSQNSEASGQIMAYYDKNSSETIPEPSDIDSIIIELIKTTPVKIPQFKHKQRLMTFIDNYYESPDDKTLLYSYQYPVTHPLIQGHFPGNPVMMGVCQWQMLEDAIYHYVSEFYKPDNSLEKISCSAEIFKNDLTPVCDIKNATLAISYEMNCLNVKTESVKKILFKQKVQPSDNLFIKINIQ